MLLSNEETVEMASLFNFGFVRKRAAEGQPRLSGPADNEVPSRPLTIFNPITWQENLEDFGEVEIATIKDHLVRVAPKREGELDEQLDEQLREEWEDWLDLVGPSALRQKSFRELMGRLRDGRARFPLLQIFDILLLVHKFNVLHFFTKCTRSSRVFFLHRFAIVRFGVLFWRPGFDSWFQFGD